MAWGFTKESARIAGAISSPKLENRDFRLQEIEAELRPGKRGALPLKIVTTVTTGRRDAVRFLNPGQRGRARSGGDACPQAHNSRPKA